MKFSKEYYKNQIIDIANILIEKSDDILNDWDKGVISIKGNFEIKQDSIPIIDIKKEYSAIRYKKEN